MSASFRAQSGNPCAELPYANTRMTACTTLLKYGATKIKNITVGATINAALPNVAFQLGPATRYPEQKNTSLPCQL